MQKQFNEQNLDYLFRAILSLQTREECFNFLRDVCTIQEINAISQRLVVARLLKDSMVYSDIVARTGASTATISRVNRSLLYGCDGYETVLSRIGSLQSEKIPAEQDES